MTFGYQGDPFDIFDEQAYDFQQRQPGEFEVEGSDHASVPGSSDRVREHGQGKLEYRCDDGSWISAYYHVNLRARLLSDAGARGTYDFKRAERKGLWDKTSYLPSQKRWGEKRASRPRILYIYEKPPGYQGRQGAVPYMYRYGKLVLSIDNQPIVDYPDIPDVLSSQLEGYIMEAVMRLDRRITIEDFRMRMESHIVMGGGQGRKALFDANTFASRMRRFRTNTFNIVWSVDRGGSKEIKHLFDSLLSPACKATNSTRNWHDLYAHERLLREMLSFGMFLERAGKGRNRTDEEREAIFQKLFAKLDKQYTDFKQQQHGLAISGRTDVHLVDDSYHQAVEGWLSGVHAQRVAKGTLTTSRRHRIKRKVDTASWDESDQEYGDYLVETAVLNPRRMTFGPPIIPPSKKPTKLATGLSPKYQETVSAPYRSIPFERHTFGSIPTPCNEDRRTLAISNKRKRTMDGHEDDGRLGSLYNSYPDSPPLSKQQRVGNGSSNDDRYPKKNYRFAPDSRAVVDATCSPGPLSNRVITSTVHSFNARAAVMGSYDPASVVKVGVSSDHPQLPDNTFSLTSHGHSGTHCTYQPESILGIGPARHLPPYEPSRMALPKVMSTSIQPNMVDQREQILRTQAGNAVPRCRPLTLASGLSGVQDQPSHRFNDGTEHASEIQPRALPDLDSECPITPPTHLVGRRRRPLESQGHDSQAQPPRRATSVTTVEVYDHDDNNTISDDSALEIASPGDAAQICAQTRSRAGKHSYPILPYVPNPPNSGSDITQGDRLRPCYLENSGEVASLHKQDMPNGASCASVEGSCLESCGELPLWLTDLDTILNCYDQMGNMPGIAPQTVADGHQNKLTLATPSVPSSTQDPQNSNLDMHSADALPNDELSYPHGSSLMSQFDGWNDFHSLAPILDWNLAMASDSNKHEDQEQHADP